MRKILHGKPCAEAIDGKIEFDDYIKNRAKLYIEAQGHGIRGNQKGWGSVSTQYVYNLYMDNGAWTP